MFIASHWWGLIDVIIPVVPALVVLTMFLWQEMVNLRFDFWDFWNRLFVNYFPFFSWFIIHSPCNLSNIFIWLPRPIKLFKPCQTAHTRQAWAFIIPRVVLWLYNGLATPRHFLIFFFLLHISWMGRQRRLPLTKCLLKSLWHLFCAKDTFSSFSFRTWIPV